MTIIYTETHLTSDPVYDEKNTAIFNIALSNLSIQCQAHRPEHIDYIQRNQIRTGDLIRIRGVFLSPASASHPYYIKVSSFVLAPQHQRYTSPATAVVVRGKRRRVDGFLVYDCLTNSWIEDPTGTMTAAEEYLLTEEDDSIPTAPLSSAATMAAGTPLSSSSTVTPMPSPYPNNNSTAAAASTAAPTLPSPHSVVANMTEFNGPFNEYFFMIFGEAQYICQCAQLSLQQQEQRERAMNDYQPQGIKKQLQQYQLEQMMVINSLLEQIYMLYQAMDKSGLSKFDVVNFVNTVSSFVDRLNELQRSCQDTIHEGLNLNSRRIILPSVIYRFYASLFQ